MSCTECNKRARQGPHYDPARGTGRTTQRVKVAIIGALGGHRVLYVTHNDCYARELLKQAMRHLEEAGVAPMTGNVTAYRITFLNGGWLEFRSMGAMPVGRGLKAQFLPTKEWWDHFAEEERERLQQQQMRLDDAATIKQLMRKHGWHYVDDILARRDVGRACDENKLVFRT
jgi:hypothetical protein